MAPKAPAKKPAAKPAAKPSKPSKPAKSGKSGKGGPGAGSQLEDILSQLNPFKKKEPPRTPIKGCGIRITNAIKNNFRGILGVLLPAAALLWKVERDNAPLKVELMWAWMAFFYLLQPVAIPVVGMIPIFCLPMTGTISTNDTCACYMNENVVLFIITAMLILLLQNSGVDRRLMLWFICCGDACQYSGKRLILKVSTAAFFLSMFSSRLIVTSTLTQIMTNALTRLDSTTVKDDPTNPNFVVMRNVMNNAIQTASAIGSTAIMHSAFVTMLFRGCVAEYAPEKKEYPDMFNYLSYSAFAFPVAFAMFIFNVCYHMMLCNWTTGKSMTNAKMEELRGILGRYRAEIPRRVSLHERLSVIFAITILCMFFFRWNQWIDGWADFATDADSPNIPNIKDATVAASFLILLSIIPKGYGFLQFLDAEKKSELPPLKPESPILWWRFIDRNVNYGYVFTFGGTYAVVRASVMTGLDHLIAGGTLARMITDKPWNTSLFFVVFLASLFCNMTTSLAACGTFLPFVLAMAQDGPSPWPGKFYIPALGVGIASSFGFCIPFQYNPAYYCHHTGKVPIMKMIKYSFMSVWICMLTLYVALLIWAPFLFDPDDSGIWPSNAPGVPAGPTTVPPDAPPPP